MPGPACLYVHLPLSLIVSYHQYRHYGCKRVCAPSSPLFGTICCSTLPICSSHTSAPAFLSYAAFHTHCNCSRSVGNQIPVRVGSRERAQRRSAVGGSNRDERSAHGEQSAASQETTEFVFLVWCSKLYQSTNAPQHLIEPCCFEYSCSLLIAAEKPNDQPQHSQPQRTGSGRVGTRGDATVTCIAATPRSSPPPGIQA